MSKEKETMHDEETVDTSNDDIEIIEDEATETDESIEAEVVSMADYQAVLKENEELKNKMLRIQAEYDNFRKRTQREKAADLKYKSQDLATELLNVVDNFERALDTKPDDEKVQSYFEGIEMVYRQLITALNQAGVEPIETDGETFDPNLHQAVIQVEDDSQPTNTVIETLQKGYRLKDRVIRPAMVKVNQ
ncbi:molecular chaperone GrpE [Streptohalobacillus salinus]|uniref:Protein GrpE n=1 Tax=Streptohalobacillus salinus TaxID=621096 RepID=A0A2V3WEN7_9BACI|nr:nucleotide exchange factor GrpE [Streptohalobacillus salinus]PXW91614.1 molecular chaperone GrpE [Streptohalobacillus salinus]